jgi:tetratricopeptide (TPR) repeat protein
LRAQLDDPNLGEMERQLLWEKARKSGMTDALVKAMEQRVEREPNNPDLRLDMGKAYLQKVFEAGGGPMAGVWATKADKAFDSALELDPQHWESRFQKAVSLSFWPPALGKQGQAIGEFETLVAQQNAGPKQAQHAQTYLFLGNLYQQSGSIQKAIDAWQKGSNLFPENEALKKQIQSAKQL